MTDTTTGRVRANLTGSTAVCGLSIAVIALCWYACWPGPPGVPLIVHVASGLCLFWVLAGSAARWCGRDSAPGDRESRLASAAHVGALWVGVLAVVLMLYAAIMEGILRTLFYDHARTVELNLWPSGFVDLGLLICAALVAWRQSRNPELVTGLFWLCMLGVVWLAFQVPASQPAPGVRGEYAIMTRWAAWVMAGAAAVVGAFTLGGGMIRRSRRERAWPDRLSLLAEDWQDWPGFRYSAGLVGVTVLFLGCVYVLAPWTAPAALVAGGAMLALAGRQWNENLAEVGLALITLGVVALVRVPFGPPRWWSTGAWASAFNQVMLGLALMTAFWYWLAGVWQQQLDEGRPWTTAGRLIHPAQRVGCLAGAAALLISIHVSFWPRLPFVLELDVGAGRWFWGLATNVLLVLAFTFAGVQTRRPTQAWLAFFALGSMAAFVLMRLPDSAVGQAWASCWPVLLAGAAAPLLPMAALAARSDRWRAFREPTYLSGLVVLPVSAMAGALFGRALLMPQWVPAAVFLALAGVYTMAAFIPGPRPFLAVAVLCGAAGLSRFPSVGDRAGIEPIYLYVMLCGVAAAMLGLLSQGRRPTKAARFAKWAGGLVAALSLAIGWAVSRG